MTIKAGKYRVMDTENQTSQPGPEAAPLDLGIVIVNYNTADLLRACLRSLYASAGVAFQVVVVDNCSPDNSAQVVRDEFPPARLIVAGENQGYACANNLGLREFMGEPALRPRYVMLLNADTELPPTALARMVAFLDEHPEAGVAGPKLVRQDGSLDLACRRSFPDMTTLIYRRLGLHKLFPDHPRFARYNLTFLDPDETTEVDSVVGAFMMLRTEILDQVGLLDESFFMYGEDLDWAYRIKQAGWKVYYYPAVEVLHYKGESSKQRVFKTTYEFYRAMYVFYQKHYARNTNLLLRPVIVAGIVVQGGWALLRNALRSAHQRRVC